jgi:hypothetical protein
MTNLNRFARVTRLLADETRSAIYAGEVGGLIAGIVEGLAVAIVSTSRAERQKVADACDAASNQLVEVACGMLVNINGAHELQREMLERFRRIAEGREF